MIQHPSLLLGEQGFPVITRRSWLDFRQETEYPARGELGPELLS